MRLRLFVRAYRLSRWADRRFTPAGKTVLLLALVSGVFGLDTGRTAAYQVFALCAALVVVAAVSVVAWRPGVRVRRILPEVATAGVPMRYELRITSDRPLSGAFVLHDELLDRFPTARQFRQDVPARDPASNAVDRRIGYPRWVALGTWLRGGTVAPVSVSLAVPAGEVRVDACLTPLRRGPVRFARTRLLRSDVLGLLRGAVVHPTAQSLWVLPRTYPVPDLRFPGTRRHHRGGELSVPEVGDSQEFLQVRDYRPGDPLRRIHWGRSARTGRLVVKEMGEEFFARYGLVLDTFGGDSDRTRFEAAVTVAASLARHVRATDALLDLLFVEERAVLAPAGRGPGSRMVLLRTLAGVQPARTLAFGTLADAVLAHASRLSACVHVLLEADAPRAELVQRLARRGVAQMVLTLRDPDPDFRVGAVPVHVIDADDPGRSLAAMPTEVR